MIEHVATLGRFLAGHDVDGNRRTDARWAHPGTQTVNGHRASRWAYYSHRRRAGVRWLALGAVTLTAYGALTDVWSTITTLRAAFWCLVAFVGWVVTEKSRRYVHRREVVAPLAEALALRLGDSRYVLDPRSWLVVPVDVQDRPTRVHLPKTYAPTEAQEKALVRLVARKVGLVSPSSHFEMRGETPYCEIRPAPAPREVVRFTDPDLRRAVEDAPEGRPVLGFGPRDTVIDIDLDAESPHIGVSVATGGGKSVLARGVAAQVLHDGGTVLVLDRKIESQLWAMQLPSVRYACSPKEIYNALMSASGEIDRRFELVRDARHQGRTLDRTEIGPRLLIVCEEVNALEIDLRIWWRSIRDRSDPVQCPALPVLGRILAMGRAGRVHMIVIAQKLTCQAIGGPAARENLSTRILGRATVSTWNMLAPECKVAGKFPRSSRVRGRVHVVVGDEATPVQVALWTEDEAAEWAQNGIRTPFEAVATDAVVVDGEVVSADTGGEVPPASAGVSSGEMSGDEVPHLQLIEGGDGRTDEADEAEQGPPWEPELITLADAARRHDLGLKALRNGRDRDPAFPEPMSSAPGHPSTYRADELAVWVEGRAAGVGGGAL